MAAISYENYLKYHSVTIEMDKFFREWQQYCLPTSYQQTPLVLYKKRITVTLGDLERDKLPRNLFWQVENDNSSTPLGQALICQKIDGKNNWKHLIVINV